MAKILVVLTKYYLDRTISRQVSCLSQKHQMKIESDFGIVKIRNRFFENFQKFFRNFLIVLLQQWYGTLEKVRKNPVLSQPTPSIGTYNSVDYFRNEVVFNSSQTCIVPRLLSLKSGKKTCHKGVILLFLNCKNSKIIFSKKKYLALSLYVNLD